MTGNKKLLALVALLVAVALLFKDKLQAFALAGDAPGILSVARVKALAEDTMRRYFAAFEGTPLTPLMLRAIAEIESGRDPLAIRAEPHINDASLGLMQTLFSTAEWLARDMGFTAFGETVLVENLFEPGRSMYYGASYLVWLQSYKGENRSEEFIVRGYNGGPDGVNRTSTEDYWRKYQAAKAELAGLAVAALDSGGGRV